MAIGEVEVRGSAGAREKWRNGMFSFPFFLQNLSFSVLHPGTGILFTCSEELALYLISLPQFWKGSSLIIGRLHNSEMLPFSFLFLFSLTCLKEAKVCLRSSFPIPYRETWKGRHSLTIATTLLVLPLLKIKYRKSCWDVPVPSLEEIGVSGGWGVCRGSCCSFP